MKKTVKRFVALLLALCMLLSLTACHRANERALSINGSGYTSAFYSCALVFADMEAQQLVLDTLGQEAYNDYLNQTLEGVDYKTWVKNRALFNCKRLEYYKSKCESLMIPTEEYSEETTAAADTYWTYYGYSEIMQANGVGRGTFRGYMGAEGYCNAYFDYLYGKDGEKEISQKDIDKEISANYQLADTIVEDLTEKTEKEIKEITEKFEKYAERIKKGEKFEKIYAEHLGTGYEDDNKEETETFSFAQANIIGNEGTDYENVIFSDIKDMKAGEIKVFEKKEEHEHEEGEEVDHEDHTDSYALYLVYKGDINSKENTQKEDIENMVRHSLKDEEFDEANKPEIEALSLEENTNATKQFKVDKIKYPES